MYNEWYGVMPYAYAYACLSAVPSHSMQLVKIYMTSARTTATTTKRTTNRQKQKSMRCNLLYECNSSRTGFFCTIFSPFFRFVDESAQVAWIFLLKWSTEGTLWNQKHIADACEIIKIQNNNKRRKNRTKKGRQEGAYSPKERQQGQWQRWWLWCC